MKYTNLIRDFCTAKGIDIPVGFGRHAANRYAAIDHSTEPAKLIARTWFTMVDVVYFLRSNADCRFTIIDFKDGIELIDTGGKRLKRGQAID